MPTLAREDAEMPRDGGIPDLLAVPAPLPVHFPFVNYFR